jgi:hypothetical protein
MIWTIPRSWVSHASIGPRGDVDQERDRKRALCSRVAEEQAVRSSPDPGGNGFGWVGVGKDSVEDILGGCLQVVGLSAFWA